MGVFYPGVPQEHVAWMQAKFGLRHFVETGTFRGKTAAWAADRFAQVTTIEAFKPLYETAKARYQARSNIDFRLGDTCAVLSALVPTLQSPALFWLDAHWSGAGTAGEGNECPVMEELAIINQSPLPHIILIDDARLFLAPPAAPSIAEQWPDILTVYSALQNDGRRYACTGFDVVYGVPAEFKADFLADWRGGRSDHTALIASLRKKKSLLTKIKQKIGL